MSASYAVVSLFMARWDMTCRNALVLSLLLSQGCSARTQSNDTSLHWNDAGNVECRVDSDCSQLGSYYGWGDWTCYGPGQQHCGKPTLGHACRDNSWCSGSVCTQGSSGPDAGHVCTTPVNCTYDNECEGGFVCRKDPRIAWTNNDKFCSEPCKTEGDCLVTDTCDKTGHCRERSCAECPSYFSCIAGSCVIPTCVSDGDCPGGYCVAGMCAGTFGACSILCF